jgi:hypothetical protein
MSDISTIVFGLCVLAIGVANLIWPKHTLAFRNRFPAWLRRLDHTESAFASKYGTHFMRGCGVALILVALLILGVAGT